MVLNPVRRPGSTKTYISASFALSASAEMGALSPLGVATLRDAIRTEYAVEMLLNLARAWGSSSPIVLVGEGAERRGSSG